MKRKPPQLDKPYSRHRPVLPEEVELWLEEAQSGGKKAAADRAIGKISKKRVKTPIKSSNPPTPNSQSPTSLDKDTATKLRRGKIAVDAVLDLHGHTQATAHAVLARFIEEAQKRGVRTVLVITGKGKNGQGGALRRELPRWLAETPLRGRIIAYDNAGPRHGGDGAWYVRIRKNGKL